MRVAPVAILLAALVLVARAAVARADSCEPDDSLVATKDIQAALASCEDVARVTTSVADRYAALCRAACYAFKLAEPGGDAASDTAKRGVDLAAQARKLLPERVEAHYRYALCLGIYLRENKLKALTKVDDLIAAAKRAAELDERYDRGGPHRLLALLYAEAPRFVGPGDRALARQHLSRLAAIAGDDEENKLAGVKVCSEIGESDEAKKRLKAVDPERGRDEAARKELRAERARLAKELGD